MAAFSSPLVVPMTTSRTPDDVFEAPDLLPFEMSQLRSESSPAQAFKKIVYLSAFLTRSEKRKVAAAFRSFNDRSSAESSPINMDLLDANETLKSVGRSVSTRAQARAAETALRKAAQEQAKIRAGAKRAAKRAEVASRPVKTMCVVDNCGHVSTY